ncbi:hypothetical protein CF61_01090 [Escherichia coli]|nr:hypothetical protein CF61_01090 [Escherichia coli]
MLNTLIVGASGYAGAELVTYVNRHPHMNITALTVSAQSNDAGKLISDHPQLPSICQNQRINIGAIHSYVWLPG